MPKYRTYIIYKKVDININNIYNTIIMDSIYAGHEKQKQIPVCAKCSQYPLYTLNSAKPDEVIQHCPLCKEKTSRTVQSIIDEIELTGKEEPDHQCQVQGHQNEKAECFCINCNIWICRKCQFIHEENKHDIDKHKNHILQKCLTHSKDYNQYCKTCNLNLCEDCVKNHNGHLIIQEKDFQLDSTSRKEFSKQSAFYKSLIGQSKAIHSKIIKLIDDYKKDINNYFNKVYKINQNIVDLYKYFFIHAQNYRKNYNTYYNLSNFCTFSPKQFIYTVPEEIKFPTFSTKDLLNYKDYLINNAFICQTTYTELNSLQHLDKFTNQHFIHAASHFIGKDNKNYLILGYNTGSIGILDISPQAKKNALQPKNNFEHNHKGPILCLLYHDNYIYSGSTDQYIKKWKISNNNECVYETQYIGHRGDINKIIINPNKGNIISCSTDKKIIIWNKMRSSNDILYIEKEGEPLTFNNAVISIVLISKSNNNHLLAATADHVLHLYDISTRKKLSEINNVKCGYPGCILERTDDIIVGGGHNIIIVSVSNNVLKQVSNIDLTDISEKEKKNNVDLKLTEGLVTLIPEGNQNILFSNAKNRIYKLSLQDGKIQSKELPNEQQHIDGFIKVDKYKYAVILGNVVEIISS